MSSVKVVLRKKKTKDGKYPLAIRITKSRKSSYVYVNQSIKLEDWDNLNQRVKKSHPNSTRLNNFLIKKLSEINDKVLESEIIAPTISSLQIKKGIRNTKGIYFFDLADEYLDNFKTAGKYNRWHPERSRLNKFKTFIKNEIISFEEINVSLLNRYKAWLRGKYCLSERSIVNHLILIRTIYNIALKNNIVDAKNYPFGQSKIQIKLPDSIKLGLTAEEVKRIENLNLPLDTYINHCRNLWLFSFYFAGMRVSDVLRLTWNDIQDKRLTYKMGKNNKAGSLAIPQKANKILDYYRKNSKIGGYIFPELNLLDSDSDKFIIQKKMSNFNKRINKELKKVAGLAFVEKKLTMHVARHTFGNISGDKISIQMLQKLYRHSSITTTIGYQANFIYKDADEALNEVLDF